jgi:hypothetical protein
MKGFLRFLVRFGLVTLLGFLVTPYIRRAMDQLAQRTPDGSVAKDILVQLADDLAHPLVTAFGETVTDLVFR